jgi:radical SAM protein with 4Fe4S-binding SPASM domain
MDLTRFGDKVVFFSDTVGGGAAALVRRVQSAFDREPTRLYDDVRRKLHRRFRPHRPLAFPQAVHIEVTNACNLRCVMCPREGMQRPVGQMDRRLFGRLIDELAEHRREVESVALMGLGEPFLHKELLDFARLAKERGLARLYTSSNATLLDERRGEDLLAADAFDQLILSIDGGKKIYESLRPGARYETVAGNIRNLLAAKRRRGVSRPAIDLQILLMNETENEIESFCEHWVPLLGPGDRILVKEVDTFAGQVPDRRTAAHRSRQPAVRIPCRQLWKDISISWDGRVTVCCKDVLYKLALGDANQESLADLWRSARWNAIRRLHLEKSWNALDPCRTCSEWWI